jgi:hypothetical protein
MAIKKAAVLFGDDGANGKRVPIALSRPTTDSAYGVNNRAIGFGEQLTSMIANRPLYALALNDEDLESQISAAITSLTTAFTDADNAVKSTLRTEFQNADNSVRNDFATADNAVKSTLRSEFAAADTVVANNAQSALSTQITRLDKIYNYDTTGTQPALNQKITNHENRLVTIESTNPGGLTYRVVQLESGSASSANVTALSNRVTAIEDLTASGKTINTTIVALRDLTGTSTLVSTLTAIRDFSGSSTIVSQVTALRDLTGSSALVTAISNLRNKVANSSTLVTQVDTNTSNISSLQTANVTLATMIAARVQKTGDTMTGPLLIQLPAGQTNNDGLTLNANMTVAGGITAATLSAQQHYYSPARSVTGNNIPVGKWSSTSNLGVKQPTSWHRWAITMDASYPSYAGQGGVWGISGPGTVQIGEGLHIPIRGALPTFAQLTNIRLGLFFFGSAPSSHYGQWYCSLTRQRDEIVSPVKINGNGSTNADMISLPNVAAGAYNPGSQTLTFLDIAPYAAPLALISYDYELHIFNNAQVNAGSGVFCVVSATPSYTLSVIVPD